jgi:hypothetical protein
LGNVTKRKQKIARGDGNNVKKPVDAIRGSMIILILGRVHK